MRRKADPTPAPGPAARTTSARVTARQATRREDRVAAAQGIVAAHGLHGLTAASMAEATGTVPAALYRTFSSMDALKGELVAQALDRLADSLGKSLARIDDDEPRRAALRRIHAVADAVPALRRARKADHELVDAALSALTPVFTDEVAAHVEVHLQRVLRLAATTFDDAVRARALAPGDPAQRTLVLLALVHGVDHLKKRDRLEPAARHAARVLHEGVRALLLGWGAPANILADLGGAS